MSKYLAAATILLSVINNAVATGIAPYPDEVEQFIDRREMCNHFRGEEPYDEARAGFLAEMIDETCTGTDQELVDLKRKYKDNETAMQALARFEENIEAPRTKPLASWGVHSIVTKGRTTYEGDKIRAVLEYGEIGNPTITIEWIHVDMGYPSPNRVVWTTRVDILGGEPSPCPVAENYCATVENLSWHGDDLRYELTDGEKALRCTVSNILTRAPTTTCQGH